VVSEGKGKKMKAYVLDSTALLYEPDMIYKMGFGDTLVVPTAVFRDIDMCKNSDNEYQARAARNIARTFDQLGSYQDLAAGAQLRTGTILQTCTQYERIRDFADSVDNRVLGTALRLKEQYRYVAVVSRDRRMREVARAHGLRAKNYPFYLTGLDKVTPVPARAAAVRQSRPESFIKWISVCLGRSFSKKGFQSNRGGGL
jgi:predicted ribonuclease YlaK